MKYSFDFLEIEPSEDGKKARVYTYGSKSGKEVTLSLEPKSRFQKYFTHRSAKDYPNIVLKSTNSGLGSKIRLNKIERGCIRFSYSGLVLAVSGSFESSHYATKSTVESFIKYVNNKNS